MSHDEATLLHGIVNLQTLPDGAIPVTGIALAQWIDEDGNTCWGVITAGDASRSTVIGLLNMAAHYYLHGSKYT